MADTFHPGDRVFAKIKYWFPWPAKVLKRMEGKGEFYSVLFYGTYNRSIVRADDIFVYNEENKLKYGKVKKNIGWKEALVEIGSNVPIGESGPLKEEAIVKKPVRRSAGSGASKSSSSKRDCNGTTKSAAHVVAERKGPSRKIGNGKATRRKTRLSAPPQDGKNRLSTVGLVAVPEGENASLSHLIKEIGQRCEERKRVTEANSSFFLHLGRYDPSQS